MNLKNMKKFIKTNKTTPPINLGVWFFAFFGAKKGQIIWKRANTCGKSKRLKMTKALIQQCFWTLVYVREWPVHHHTRVCIVYRIFCGVNQFNC